MSYRVGEALPLVWRVRSLISLDEKLSETLKPNGALPVELRLLALGESPIVSLAISGAVTDNSAASIG
jgi:hypothetical protein